MGEGECSALLSHSETQASYFLWSSESLEFSDIQLAYGTGELVEECLPKKCLSCASLKVVYITDSPCLLYFDLAMVQE